MPPLARQPGLDRSQRVRAHAHEAPLPLDPALDQTGSLQHLQVTRDRRRANRKRRRDLADAEFSAGEQSLDDGPPRRIGERCEQSVELWGACSRRWRELALFEWLVN